MADGNRWRVVVELTWDVLPEDLEEKAPGDTEADFGQRALARVRPKLESILRHGDPRVADKFAHFHILKPPHRCTEFD